jgi:hypothetical protein
MITISQLIKKLLSAGTGDVTLAIANGAKEPANEALAARRQTYHAANATIYWPVAFIGNYRGLVGSTAAIPGSCQPLLPAGKHPFIYSIFK